MSRIITKKVIILFDIIMALILISSSSISINLIKKISSNNSSGLIENNRESIIKISNGLAPQYQHPFKLSNELPTNIKKSSLDRGYMYGYKTNPAPEELVWFEIDDPGTFEEIGLSQSDNFISGGTCIPSINHWLGCEYGTGAIWEIDFSTGEMNLIGGGGENLNSLAYDPCYNRIYGSGDDNCLYEINPDTGEQEMIGAFGNDVDCMIGMSFDADCVLYGWDLGCDKLWTIDTESGEATEVGSLGIDLNYAQDGDIHRETDVLYLTAYTTTGQLYQCDIETGQCTLIGNFEDGAQITASLFDQCYWCCEHDIGLKSIDYPKTGQATPNMKMQITVKNLANNTETFNTKLEVMKNVSGPIIMQENFDGDFPPDGWTTDFWTQSYTNESGGTSPEARVYNYDQYNGGQYYDNFIQSGYINCSGYNRIKLRFRWASSGIYQPNYCTIYVMVRKSPNSSWKYVTPWGGALQGNQTAQLWETEWIDFDGPLGEELQIRWEYNGYYLYYDYFWLDDISIEACDDCLEYSEKIEDIVLEPGKYKKIDFPSWTPNDWQNESYENKWIQYLINANIDLDCDQNPRNNEKKKWIDLYFGYSHDVGCNNISGLLSGPAQTFPVISHVKNFGQYNETDFKTYVEISELDIENKVEIINEDFPDSTFPPNGWTKTHDNWMYSSSNKSGGKIGEARFYYFPFSIDTFRLISPLINTSDFDLINIEFKHFVDHFGGPYNLSLEISKDCVNWYDIWKISPVEDIGPETIKLTYFKNTSSDIYISWTFSGDSFNINNWYIDDIKIYGISILEPEYEKDQYISLIKPGEEIEVEFDGWTPEYLSKEITGKKQYIAKSWTKLNDSSDQNLDNDLFEKLLILDYFHDVGIKNISSPSNPYSLNKRIKNISPPLPELYIPLGTQDIDINVVNNGTFPEFGLTCNAQIWGFFDNGNASLLYEDEISDIDLVNPVGGTKLLIFDDFNFYQEGVYGLFLDFPLEIDDFPENNQENLIIGADNSPPNSWVEEIEPPEPDGENDWYVSDVAVTICAEDPNIQEGIPGSGICGIYVTIHGKGSYFYQGDCITFIITEDGNDIPVEFWAVDCVGNIEYPKNLFTIDMDQTVPDISLSYEIAGGNKWQGWDFEFTATANDDMSGMDRVEFYLNNELQETIFGQGPEYKWTIRYNPLPNAIFKVTGYDKAGLFNSDEIIDPTKNTHNIPRIYQIFNIEENNYGGFYLTLIEKFPILKMLNYNKGWS